MVKCFAEFARSEICQWTRKLCHVAAIFFCQAW